MEDNNNYTVYMHRTPSGKVYVGITSQDPEKRWRKGTHYEDNEHFCRAIKKYGWNNIDHLIIKTNLTSVEAAEMEKTLITQYKSNDSQFGYNKSNGGDGCIGFKLSDETKKKISESLRGEKHPLYGKHPSEETRKKMSEAKKGKPGHRLGKPLDEETKKKIRETLKGQKPSEETLKKRSKALKGRKFSEEHKKKISYALTGIIRSKETKRKLSNAAKGRKTRKTTVICVETGIIYEYAKDAEIETGISRGHICSVCKGNRKTAGGYHWKYA